MPYELRSGGVNGAAVSVSTQANIANLAKGYESEDEITGRKRQPRATTDLPASKTTMYSKEEFREQYCISSKQLDLLDLEKSKKERFLGCLSQYNIESPCSRSNRSSFLSVCVRRRVPSDENLNANYAPISRYPRYSQPSPAPPELFAYDADLECSYFRRRPRSVCSQPDPKRYTWMPEDEDFVRMEWPQSVIEDAAGWPQTYTADQMASVTRGGSLPRPSNIMPCPAHTPIPPPPPPPPLTPHRTKHVSFARSHTLQTFDDTIMPAAVSGSTQPRFRRDCERLLDTRVKQPEPVPYPVMMPGYPHMGYYPPPGMQNAGPVHYPPQMQPVSTSILRPPPPPPPPEPKVVVLESLKKGIMRTQATQTEVCLGRKPLPPHYLSLSPRTIKRVKMVAAGVQTNGMVVGPRRLTKSFSEVGRDKLSGSHRCVVTSTVISHKNNNNIDHDKLQRTQSEEPPRSPCSPKAAVPLNNQEKDSDDSSSPAKSVASSQLDRIAGITALHKQAQEYFQQNFQFIHESDRDDTVDDDIDLIAKNMALNRKNLESLQQEIAKQAKQDKSLRSILSKSASDTSQSQRTNNSAHPYSKTPTFQSEPSTETSATTTTTTDDSDKNEKEIIIDFEPIPDDEAIKFTARRKSRKLQKTLSDGEILLDVRKIEIQQNSDGENVKDAPLVMSTSQENMCKDERDREAKYKEYITQSYVQTPIKDEGIFGFDVDGSYSSSDGNAPNENFHEKYISYKHDSLSIKSASFDEEEDEQCLQIEITELIESTAKSSPNSADEDISPKHQESNKKNLKTVATLSPLAKSSPCVSMESLLVDQSRDHSDGNWNESQTTVLQVDSGTDNGTVMSSSDLSSLAASPGSLALLTPTSRRKHLLLLQHQQRSSLDTDALDEEFDASQAQSPNSPRNKLEATSPTSYPRPSLSPPAAVVPNIPITKQPTSTKPPPIINKMNHAPAIAITYPSLDLTDVPFLRTKSFINKKRERALSPSRRKDLQRKAQQKEPNGAIPSQMIESPSDPSLSKVSTSETSLARTDSGKTNTTDMSESTTTDDYVTANSDSSKKSGNNHSKGGPENRTLEGSSFESASSLYSTTKVENTSEDVAAASYTPPLPAGADFKLQTSSTTSSLEKTTKSPENIDVNEIKPKSIDSMDVKAKRNKTELLFTKEVPIKKSPKDSVKSSSSGSYSVGSNVTEEVTVKKENEVENSEKPVQNEANVSVQSDMRREQCVPIKGSLSDDERSGHYSSSGYYESPAEDDDDGGLTYKHSQKYRSSTRSWLSDEKRRKKKSFMLEFSKSYDDSVSSTQDDFDTKPKNNGASYKSEKGVLKLTNLKSPSDEPSQNTLRKKKAHFADKPRSVQSSPREQKDIEKAFKESETRRPMERERHVKRKLKAKSPTQSKTEIIHSGHRPHLDRREAKGPNMKLQLNVLTSDDSSEHYKKEGSVGNGSLSPRKHRRIRESPRRKAANNSTLAKSPTSSQISYGTKKNNGSSDSISLPGSLPRRKQSIPTIPASSLEAEDIETTKILTNAGSRLTPLRYIKSPNASPRHQRKEGTDCKFGKAASAESLRSVSPGSDSVFYSEQADNSANIDDAEAKAHCLHCGKEVHIVTAPHEHDSRTSRTSHTDESFTDVTPEIVPAPAGFADSPSCSHSKKSTSSARLYKKLEKRFRSEDKSRHYRQRQDVRAKSEERGKEEYVSSRNAADTRIARSAGNSLDKLAGSSASVDIDDLEDGSGSSGGEGIGDDRGIYAAPWWCGNWILIHDNDDQWERIPPDAISDQDRMEEPTDSESEFNKRYVALTHRLVHRRACVHLVRKRADNSFVNVNDAMKESKDLKSKLQEILKLMLVLWCRQCQVNKLVTAEPAESDKTVVVKKGDEEFGFRIHGSKPVVVSAIEPDTLAETSGLEVGDIIIAVNGINVIDKSHSEVVKIAHAGSDILKLEVARTCEAVASLAHEGGPAALYAGYLWRSAPTKPHVQSRWTRRWFVLKRDNCLYYYKTDSSIHPVGALMLVNYELSEEEAGKAHGFRLFRGGGARLSLAADSAEAAARWRAVLAHAIDASKQRDGWLEATMRNMKLPPSSIPRPDCFGYLMKLGSKWKSWAKRYCVLKDACLYFYTDGTSKNAFGMACLHGYRVQQCAPGGKKFAFEVMPTETKQRHFYFYTESEMDKKRWMAALEYSIDRWMKAG